MFSGQLKARESEGPTHLSATSLCPDHSKQLLIPGSLALPTSFPLHLTSPASLLDPAHQPLPLHCSIMQISKPLNEHRNKMVKGRKSYNMALSFNFLISCPSWNKFAFPGPELNLPTFHLWKTYAKKAHWFGPLQLKAKMWAIWGNLDFSISESKFRLHVLKCVTRNTGKISSGLASADVHLSKHLAELT